MDKFIGFVLEQIIYRVLIFLKKRNYIIPIDTSKDNIFRQNVFINSLSMAADWVCAILVIFGWTEHIITYISLITMASYTFVEQYKIYYEQYKYLNNDEYICKIKNKQNKYLKKYTPNLKNMVIAGLIFTVLLFMVIFEKIGYYEATNLTLYRYLILTMLIILIFIKTKYMFFDIFDVKEFTWEG